MGRITAFIGAAAIGLAMLAFAPAAMAMSDPPADICLLDLSCSADIEFAVDATADIDILSVEAAVDFVSRTGVQVENAWPAAEPAQPSLDFAIYRQHFDLGRMPV